MVLLFLQMFETFPKLIFTLYNYSKDPGCGDSVVSVTMFQIQVEADAQVPGLNPAYEYDICSVERTTLQLIHKEMYTKILLT